jgi:transposase-like protein
MCPEAKAAALLLRKGGLSLDECLDALEPLYKTARATLYRFFVREGVGNLKPAKTPVGTFKDYEPGFLHIDCTYLPLIEGRARFVFVAIDRATRLACIAVFEKRNVKSALEFLKDAIDFFPFKVHRILTDNGAEFTNRFFKRWNHAIIKTHPFEAELARLRISHRFTKPYTPKTNGMVERLNRNLKDNTLGRGRYDSHDKLENDLLAWVLLYNAHKKHSSISRRTPLQEAQRWYILKPEIFTKDPTAWASRAFGTS